MINRKRQLATAWMRDRLIEEFRERLERSTHDVMIEVIIDKVFSDACNKEVGNLINCKHFDLRPKMDFDGPKVERRKFTEKDLKHEQDKP